MTDYFSKQNTGGAIASRGFSYQDYCALIELFTALKSKNFIAISTETIDDFTIFSDESETLYQVKKMQFDTNVVNHVLDKNSSKKQKFIFTSKDSHKYNGIFDKTSEYHASKTSSRNTSEKETIKKEIIELLKDKNIEKPLKYLDTTVLIFEETNITDILYSKYTQWLENEKFEINSGVDFLNELRLKISDLRNSRGELKQHEFYEIVKKYKLTDVDSISTKDLKSILGWYQDIQNIEIIKDIYKFFPNNRTQVEKAESYIESNNYSDALTEYLYILKTESTNTNIELIENKIANLYFKDESYEKTIEVCKKYNSKDFLLLRAVSYGQLNENESALNTLEKIKETERDYIIFYNLATSCMFTNDREQAIKYFKLSIKDRNDFFESYLSLAVCQYSSNPLDDEVIKNLDIALELNENLEGALSQKGEVLRFLGEYSKAKSYFKKSLKLNPSNIISLRGTAFSLFRQKLYSEGLIYFNSWLSENFKDGISEPMVIVDIGYKDSITLSIENEDDKLILKIDNRTYSIQSNKDNDFMYIGLIDGYPVIGKKYQKYTDYIDSKTQLIQSLDINQDSALLIQKDFDVKIYEKELEIELNVTTGNFNIQGLIPKDDGFHAFNDHYIDSSICKIVLGNMENTETFLIETSKICEIY